MEKVYYSQIDPRWKNHPYPSPSLPKATIGSGGCGVTCAAMVVSSCREIITPDVMGDIAIQNGYRVNGGTSFDLFAYVAKRWNIETRIVNSSYEALQACKDGYFVVICCGAGLWTTGGHYILAVGADNDNIEIYDPYLYKGKFDTPARKGKVRLVGNSAWVQIDTFKANSNAQLFYAYKINEEPKKEEYIPEVKPENIKKIQQWLNDTYGMNLIVDGKTDNILKNALIIAWKLQCNKNWGAQFQADEWGRTCGGFGTKTKEFAPNVVRRYDDSGKMVKIVQAFCWLYGYNNNTFSGHYGQGTLQDVRNLKVQNGLLDNGSCVGGGFWTVCMQ